MNLTDIPGVKPFDEMIPEECNLTLPQLTTLQMNITYRCNLACKHCHLQCGPQRQEMMSQETMQDCLTVFARHGFSTIDITGGAPELNPHLPWLLQQTQQQGIHTLLRTNLTILKQADYRSYPELYANSQVELIASLPFYTAKDNDRQRGEGVFADSIEMLQRFNELGYGRESALRLNLVYNPGGAFLPPPQASLAQEYRRRLEDQYGIVFNDLYAITNNPLGRFAAFLERSNNFTGYMQRLYNAFNPAAAYNMMCRSQISVGCDGALYDCDFNQAAQLPIAGRLTIHDLLTQPLKVRQIAFGNHCYACTAGCGSSCGGATA